MFDAARDRSIVARLVSEGSNRVRAAIARSAIVRIWPVTGGLRGAVNHARLTTVGRRLNRYVVSSFSYRWLTTEPDAEPIVIDLSEARIGGLSIRIADRIFDRLRVDTSTSSVVRGSKWLTSIGRNYPLQAVCGLILSVAFVSLLSGTGQSSDAVVVGHLLVAGIAAIGFRSRRRADELLDTHLGRTLLSAFLPPELREGRDDEQKT